MRRRLVFVVAAAAVGMLFAALIVMPVFLGAGQFMYGGGAGASCIDTSGAGNQPQEAADARSIPSNYLELYKKAGADYGLPWNVLAGIGKVETSHGTSKLPGVSSGENYAGAGGPMQFLKATFKAFAVDGNKDGKKDRYDPADAIPSAARYLKHNGAPERMRTALYMYNHSWDYVDLVLSWSKRYGGGDFEVVQADGPKCSDTEGLPENVDEVIQRIINFAMAQRGKRYIFGANGPDAWDCSSLLQGAYRSVGLTIPRTTWDQWPFGVKVPKGNEVPGDLVFFNSGPGTSWSAPGHVGMVIGNGKMIAARCSTCVPNIGVQSYKRSDWVGVTRPLAKPELKKALERLQAG
ncbi:Transglycosylase SLT domain-containing protein [Thermomonospora echinospora]|uniref:Transglycosylase SLT domain-containing protein n=1 Tax=Thermomonospora echinospora TaxID=1992 RepID=A0A1H6A662_9ACTN|nr:bifunctional lytic transglycosylase/C40 family peptidase [Thermomonospora echinospora]SEG43941.1 Transglycosylase SLT domain-containing protein [Thermomonospora echinospora]